METDDAEAYAFLMTLLQVLPVLLLAYAVEFGAFARSLTGPEGSAGWTETGVLKPSIVVGVAAVAEAVALGVAAADTMFNLSEEVMLSAVLLAGACLYVLVAVFLQITHDARR